MIAYIRQKIVPWRQALLLWLICGIYHPAWAKLPTVDALSKGYAEKGNWLMILQLYVKEVGLILGLTLSFLSFAWVAYAALSKFDECRKHKAEWAELGVLVATGCGVLMFMTLLLSTANQVVGRGEYLGETGVIMTRELPNNWKLKEEPVQEPSKKE